MAKRALTLGLVQLAASEDRRRNIENALARTREAALRGATIVCLPELFASRYFCQVEDAELFDLAEPIPGPTTQAVADLARELGITIVASVFERRAAGVYHNTAVVLGPQGDTLGIYRKMHIPDDPLYYEKFYFTPGDLGFVACPVPGATLGPLVCWDQWYPEAARLTALRGAELLLYPTAIGWHPSEKERHGSEQLAAWQTMQKSHAIANGVFVVAVNRVGFEPAPGGASGLEFWGHSFVADPFGVVIAEAGDAEETLVVACDLARIEEVRRGWPFLRDRRIDAYSGLLSRLLDDR
jgi:N-carbamoylputrescine amidase